MPFKKLCNQVVCEEAEPSSVQFAVNDDFDDTNGESEHQNLFESNESADKSGECEGQDLFEANESADESGKQNDQELALKGEQDCLKLAVSGEQEAVQPEEGDEHDSDGGVLFVFKKSM